MSLFLLLIACLLIFISCVGLFTLPDAACRSHSLTIGETSGFLFLVASLISHWGFSAVGLKLLCIVAFQLFTIPISGHLLMLVIRKVVPEDKMPSFGRRQS